MIERKHVMTIVRAKSFWKFAGAVAVILFLHPLCGSMVSAQALTTQEGLSVVLQVKVSPTASHRAEMPMESKEISRFMAALQRKSKVEPTTRTAMSDTYLLVATGAKTTVYEVGEQGELFDRERQRSIMLPRRWRKRMAALRQEARKRHYGALTAWEDVKPLMPKPTRFTVLDMETGLRFRVERRAGTSHADVQPLTKADTAVMKQIYGGRWSWDRRAIIAEVGNRRFAASMHGMPHGGDGIPGNGFAGHFCVHFLGSATHRQANIDPSHQLMVHKAAGELRRYLDESPIERQIDLFITSMHMKDEPVVRMLIERMDAKQVEQVLALMNNTVSFFRAGPAPAAQDHTGDLALEAEVSIANRLNGEHEQRVVGRFQFIRQSLQDSWRISFFEMGT